jgi:uncharacterized metal-binding protein
MEGKCLCEPSEILIFSCSGASNIGQITNQAGVRLSQNGTGRFFCLAGIGGHVSGMIESTKAGKMLIAIDGCQVACAKKTLEHAGSILTNMFRPLIWALRRTINLIWILLTLKGSAII